MSGLHGKLGAGRLDKCPGYSNIFLIFGPLKLFIMTTNLFVFLM